MLELNIITVNNGKYNVSVIDNDQYIGNTIKHGYEWDGYMRSDIEKYYKPGTDIIDIGANIGYNTLMFSDYGPVHSFEPVFYKIVDINIKNNTLKHDVTLYSIALSDCNKDVTMYLPKNPTDNPNVINYGGTSMFLTESHNENQTILCKCDTLDNIYYGVPSIIKMDVEGNEINVLKGAINTLKLHKPMLYIEIGDYKNSEIPEFLKEFGYKDPEPKPEHMYIFTV
tara:strand:- start:845 stop:1522 length:678 start_codon:yes stop_codon:yes gene_type:complete